MSDEKDRQLQVRAPELPTSTRRRRSGGAEVLEPKPAAGAGRRELTEKQVDKLIDGGQDIARGAIRIGEGIVEIVRIRESADADVRRIEAKTEQVVRQLRAEIDMRREERKTLRDRGTVVVDVIEAVTRQISVIPLDDPASRRTAIEILPELVRAAASEKP